MDTLACKIQRDEKSLAQESRRFGFFLTSSFGGSTAGPEMCPTNSSQAASIPGGSDP